MELNKIGSQVGSIQNEIQKPGVNNNSPVDSANQFQTHLDKALQRPTPSVALTQRGLSEVKFSNHAIDRMVNRGIQFTKADLTKLNEAVDRAGAKGSRDSLILMNDSALIVSVKNKTVVTVMDRAQLKENVFTNIDSTIVL